MMRLGALLTVFALLLELCGVAAAQVNRSGAESPYTISYGKTLTLNVPAATAAYALDPNVADARAEKGLVRIRAVGSGTTAVVVVLGNDSTTITVTVPLPPIPKFEVMSGGGAGAGESGWLQSGYSSPGGQINNALQLQRWDGDSFRRLSIVAQTSVAPGADHGTGFPLLSYEIGGPGRDIVFLDKSVDVSPLTFTNALVRGIHVQEGPWTVHAGASSVAQFGQYLIPINPQWLVGATRVFTLSPKSSLSANLYDVINSGTASDGTAGGSLGSLLYEYNPTRNFNLSAEIGLSHSIGYAAQAHYEDQKQNFDASLLEHPANFASLANNAQQGFFAGFDYNRTFNTRLTGAVNVQRNDYTFPGSRESTLVAQGSSTFALTSNVSLNGGVLFSSFRAVARNGLAASTLSVPIGVGFSGRHFNLGVQYQPTSSLAGTFANGYGANAGVTYGNFAAGGFYQHSVDIPTISSIFSEVPGFQAALERAGITFNDPAQLASLLSNAALLSKLGFSGLSLDLAPARNDVGFNASWSTSRRQTQQVSFSYLNSSAQRVKDGSFGFSIASLAYRRQLGMGDEVSASIGILRNSQLGVTSSTPTYGINLSHRFSSVPEMLFPRKNGQIGGYVFRDDDATGTYSAGAAVLQGVEVMLDDHQSVFTDAQGHYTFGHVPYGTHRIQAKLDRPNYYFTTDSPADAQIGETVNIGVTFVQGRLFGNVVNDAGAGISGVVVEVHPLSKTATTEGGQFTLNGVEPGRYSLSVSPDSLPSGYDLSSLAPVAAQVTTEDPQPVKITVRALRSIAGAVTLYDPSRGTSMPAGGMVVAIPQLRLTCRTDSNGMYAFRNLPAGTFVVEVEGGGRQGRRSVTLSDQPTALTGINYNVTLEEAASQRQRQRHSRR